MIVRICSKCRNGILEPWLDVDIHDAPTWRVIGSGEQGPICNGEIFPEFAILIEEPKIVTDL